MLLCFEGTGMRKGRWYPQNTYMTLQKRKNFVYDSGQQIQILHDQTECNCPG